MVSVDEATRRRNAECGKELLALETALEELARMDPRQA